jgi:signal transduction histidine kinase
MFPVREDGKAVIYFAIVHIQLKNQKEENQKEELEKRNFENDMAYSLLRNVSHELRTPLNWILGFSELISRETSIDKIKEYNATISKGGNLLLALIEKLLEMSSIVNNKNEMHKSRFEVNSILDEIHGLIKNELIFIGRNLKIEISSRLSVDDSYVFSDKIMLKQVLLNLVHNSVKFTKEGKIEMGVSKSAEDELKFYVKDSGIGIENMKMKTIFDVFSKASEIDINEQYGLGLGLTISGNYVNKLGGEIWVDSEVGVGSTFSFTIKCFEEEAKVEEKYMFLE